MSNDNARILKYELLGGAFAICQLPAHSAIPAWATAGNFFSLTATDEELSIVCEVDAIPVGVKAAGPFICLKLHGPFPLNETGVLSSFIQPLANAAIPVFALATYNTDYVLIPAEFADMAVEALRTAGETAV